MSERFVSVQVPEDSRADLERLGEELGGESMAPVSAHPFDGAAFIQVVFPLTTLAAAVLRTWIVKRAEARKNMRVVVDGIEITGYTGAEVKRILDTLVDQKDLDPGEDV
jgi:hypothetical protein